MKKTPPQKEHERLLALDYGSRRIGLAISDPLRLFAQPVGTFDLQGTFDAIRRILMQDGIEKILVGYPLSESGDPNRMTAVVDRFLEELGKEFPETAIEPVDEYATSKEARRLLASTGTGRKERSGKGRIDRTAACLILQQYLDSHSLS
jgi:putative Holliday junction resolvase